MADITMCANTLCPNAGTCYRVTATPSEHWQSVASFEYTIGVDGVHCDNYLKTYTTKTTGHCSI
jgi:hypothetical protein